MKILIPIDASENSPCSAELLKRIPLPATCEVTILTVVETDAYHERAIAHTEKKAAAEVRDELRTEAGRLLEQEAERLKDTSWEVTTELREGDPAQQIIDVAKETNVDLIAVGSRGLSRFKRFLLGSVSSNVAKYAHCSVLIVPPSGEKPAVKKADTDRELPKAVRLRILVAFDGSDPTQSAVATLASLPIGDQADVRLVTVLPLIRYYRMDVQQRLSESWRRQKAEAKRSLDNAAEKIRCATPNVATRTREGQDISDEILTEADEWAADLIVIGHRSMSKIERILMGSVASRVVHHARCSVWMVRS